MKNLAKIIYSCNDREAEFISRYYLIKQNKCNKRLRLFNLMRWEGVTDDKTAARRLYNSVPNPAFCQLKKRLKEDILNILLICGDLGETDNYMDAELQASKLILQGKMLLSRGLRLDGLQLIVQAFKLSGHHEAYEMQAIAYEIMQAHQFSEDLIEEKAEELESQFYQNAKKLNQLLELRVNDSIPEHIEDTFSYDKSTVSFSKSIPDSTRLKFQYALKKMETCYVEGNFERAKTYAEDFLSCFPIDNFVIPATHKIQYFYTLSRILLCTGDYKDSIAYTTKALQFCNNESNLKDKIHHVLFRNYFYLKQYDQASDFLEKRFEKNGSESRLFQAYLDFNQKRHKDIQKALNKIPLAAGSYKKLSFHCKLLEMQNICEMGDTDWFSYKLDNLRKFLGKERVRNPHNRVSVIFDLLQTLSKNGLKKNDSTLGQFTCLLGSKSTSYSWDPMGYELIPVNQWIRSHA